VFNNTDDAPQAQIIRDAIHDAILRHDGLVLRYGRGERPGSVRTVKPVAWLDDDLFEGIQEAPEIREYTQKYRLSCVLECTLNGKLLVNPAARVKCQGLIDYFERTQRLTEQINSIESSSNCSLPSNVCHLGNGQYLWTTRPGAPLVHLKAPSRQNIAAFVALANAVALEDWGGRTWVVIDAMFKYHIDWPGWYLYAKHMQTKLRQAELDGIELEGREWAMPIPELDWPGFDFLNPVSLTEHQKSIWPLYAALHNVPSKLMLAYIHVVRPQNTQYNYSGLLGDDSTNEAMILQLYEHGLADGSIKTIIETTSIEPMREVLTKAGIELPEKKSRREPHIALVLSRPELHDKFAPGLWKYRRSIFVKAPDPLTWEELHELRAQVILMGKLLYAYLQSGASDMPVAAGLLSG